jgi:hypothetical protein
MSADERGASASGEEVDRKRVRGAAAKSVASLLSRQTLERKKPMRGSAAGIG